MFVALLKALLPHEYNDYHIEHGSRINSQLTESGDQLTVNRANSEHRAIRVKRGVITNIPKTKESARPG